MYCPNCGTHQPSNIVRFCEGCGLSLENTARLLTTGNLPAAFETHSNRVRLSRRAKGILQGITIVPASIGALFVLDIFYEAVIGHGMMAGTYAMFTLILIVALLRILYAVFIEKDYRETENISQDYWQHETKHLYK